uniref:Myosin binding protein C2 n=1 Tax=Naja naja TaxID=35670 RepID=A0A8C7E538_NAJNA
MNLKKNLIILLCIILPSSLPPSFLFFLSFLSNNQYKSIKNTLLDGAQLPCKPTIKWFKGKWLELGIKSGLRFQFKEDFDKDKNIYSYELKIEKIVIGDRGDYRIEVTAKDFFDSCVFNIDAEVQVEEEEKKKKKKKDDDDDMGIPPEIWELLKGVTKKSEYERIAFEYGITDLRGMLKRLKKAKVEIKKSAAFIKKLDPAYQVDKGQKIKMWVELSNPDLPIKWMKNGQLIKPSGKYIFENVGKKRILTITKTTLADDAAYECVAADEKCFTEVFVKEPPVLVVSGLDDQQVYVGDKVVLEVEVSEEGAQVMWLKDGVELTREDTFKYRIRKDGKKHMLIINEATKEDAGRYQIVTNGGQSEAYLAVEDKPLEVIQGIADLTVKATEQAVFKCEVSDEKVTGKWYKNGVEIRPSKRITMTHKGRVHKLVIDDVRPEDEGDYTFIPDGYALSLSAKLNFLEPPKIHLDCGSGKTNENTIIVVAGNKLRLDVNITGEPAPTATWMKGNEIFSEKEGRVRIEERQELSSFVIESAERSDENIYTIKVTNPVGEDVAFLNIKVVDVPDPPETVRVTSVGEDWAILVWEPPKYDGGMPITGEYFKLMLCGYETTHSPRYRFPPSSHSVSSSMFFEFFPPRTFFCLHIEQPRIRLPRHLRQTYIKKVGEQINLVIPFQGKPRPKVSWSKDGHPLDPKEIHIHDSDFDTILFIRKAERHHSGIYTLSVQIENMEDKADIKIQKPGPAHNVLVKEVWGFNALVEWEPPKDDGNSEITGYSIQKADKKTMEWFTVYEHSRPTRCTVSDLIMGNEYYFRVYSENICGLSEQPGVSKNTANIQKTGKLIKKYSYKEHDFSMAPIFLTPLVDRTVVAGYTTALNCAVRGHPKPKIIWMKNKVDLSGDPKFLQKNNQGVLTLNIRKPSPFDSATYSCKAINELGEAIIECRLEVKGDLE